ncbi:MAG: hypothetical protein AAF647_02150 [Pseudomonadota bacterium]
MGIAGLRRTGGELVGPCPCCGGRDRFAINLKTHLFQCRQCGISGGDTVKLVQEVQAVPFREALKFLMGEEVAAVDPKEIKRRRARARAAEKARAEDASRARAYAIRKAQEIWRAGDGQPRRLVEAYLKARGVDFEKVVAVAGRLPALRCIAAHPCVKRVGSEARRLHTGPAMIAAVQAPNDRLRAVHQTWIDPAPPHGKLAIAVPDDDPVSKLVRGSMKGGAIRLVTPRKFDTLVMGEGIETTLSALVAGAAPGAAFWSGVSLGNMAGRMQKIPGVGASGLPDLSDTDAFLPPPWVKRFFVIMDGDSAEAATLAKCQACARRAMVAIPGLETRIVRSERGRDLNDMLVAAQGEAMA